MYISVRNLVSEPWLIPQLHINPFQQNKWSQGRFIAEITCTSKIVCYTRSFHNPGCLACANEQRNLYYLHKTSE